DDAFSSVDVETEEQILAELKKFMQGRTTLLISHRISTVGVSGFIVYLRGGEIIERGSHDELLARRGAYYQLYQRQRLVREVEAIDHKEERLLRQRSTGTTKSWVKRMTRVSWRVSCATWLLTGSCWPFLSRF